MHNDSFITKSILKSCHDFKIAIFFPVFCNRLHKINFPVHQVNQKSQIAVNMRKLIALRHLFSAFASFNKKQTPLWFSIGIQLYVTNFFHSLSFQFLLKGFRNNKLNQSVFISRAGSLALMDCSVN